MYIIYLFIAIVIILLIYMLVIISKNGKNENDVNGDDDDDDDGIFIPKYKASPSNAYKRNCDAEIIYAMDDNQCSNICNGSNLYRVHNGRCVNALILDSSNNTINDCDPKRGVLAYLVGDPQLGRTKYQCLSIDLGIQDDSLDKENIICKNGDIAINYLDTMPQLSQCKCRDRQFLAIIPNNKTIRTHGQCINNVLLPVFAFNNAIYDSNVV